jgi:predicted dienelactone hydrolase
MTTILSVLALPARHLLALAACCLIICGFTAGCEAAQAQAASADGPYPVGLEQIEYLADDGRHLAFALLYPAAPQDAAAEPRPMQFFTNLHLRAHAPILDDKQKRPLVIFSHGAGSNGLYYAWFGEYLAARGYLVAMVYHYRANTYDSTLMFTRSKLWQRPRDLSLDITGLLQDPKWASHIDPDKIGVAGHSQGGFTSLWIGGARVNSDLYRDYLEHWRNNWVAPEYLRVDLPLDPTPALNVHDPRVKAVFAMAPGDVRGFGMDEAGLRQLITPTYIIVGARDTQATPKENSEYAATYIPHAQLDVMPGLVDHEIFVNECDALGRDTWPEACIDAPGIDRRQWHEHIGAAALKFFDLNLNVKRNSEN